MVSDFNVLNFVIGQCGQYVNGLLGNFEKEFVYYVEQFCFLECFIIINYFILN